MRIENSGAHGCFAQVFFCAVHTPPATLLMRMRKVPYDDSPRHAGSSLNEDVASGQVRLQIPSLFTLLADSQQPTAPVHSDFALVFRTRHGWPWRALRRREQPGVGVLPAD